MIQVVISYLTALAFAVLATGGAIQIWGPFHPIITALIADSVATLVIFFFSRYHNNSSIYDPYWTIVPPLLAIYWIALVPLDDLHPRVFIAFLLVLAWSARLTWNWQQRWKGLQDEDWRYQDIKEFSGRLFPLADLTAIHFLPTLLVFAGCLPLYFITQYQGDWGWLDLVALAVMGGAIMLQAIADTQLRRFLKTRQQGQILNHGLWTYARHPNYLGEVLFWWGLFLFALAAAADLGDAAWNTIGAFASGAIAINILFVAGSVPLMNARGRKYRAGYDEHIKKVNALIPLPKLRARLRRS